MASSYSAETIEGTEYLLTEILIRVPAIPLLKFKSVSKRWHSLISSHYFRHHHTLRHTATTKVSGMIMQPEQNYSTKFNMFSFDDRERRRRGSHHHHPPNHSHFDSLPMFNNDDHDNTTIWQSCNGLILGSVCHNYNNNNFFVMNPTTKDFTVIPNPNGCIVDPNRNSLVRVGLAFDPMISPNYTLICVWMCHVRIYLSYDSGIEIDLPTVDPSISLYHATVYSSESRAWNPCESIYASYDSSIDRGVYFNGAVHWIFASRRRVCSCFDVEGNRMREDLMPQLPEDESDQYYYFITPAYGHLNLVGIGYVEINVFQLKQDYSTWDPIHTVRIGDTQLPTLFPGMINFVDRRNDPSYNHPRRMCVVDRGVNYYYQCKVLELIESDAISGSGGGGGGDDDVSLLLQLGDKVVALRLKDKTFCEGFELGLGLSTYCFLSSERLWMQSPYKACAYIQSLASV